MNKEKYFVYRYTLGDSKIDTHEMEVYLGESLDTLQSAVDNLGEWEFYMYSKNDKNLDYFLSEISKLLFRDCESASRVYHTALGRFHAFDQFWKSIEA